MDVWVKGRWEAQAPGNHEIHGYHLNRLYSPAADIPRMIHDSKLLSFSEERQFQNQVLGEVYEPEGSRLTRDHLDKCREDYEMAEYRGQLCVIGVDVGIRLHVVIRERLSDRRKLGRLWFAETLASFDELDDLWRRFSVKWCVIDNQPETHLARQFAIRYPKQVYLANYDRSQSGHQSMRHTKTGEPNYLSINRTEAFDELTKRVQSRELVLPRLAHSLGGQIKDDVGEYYRHMTALKRTREQDSHGNWRDKWIDEGKPDHFAHAEVYAMLTREIREGGRPLTPRSFKL